MEGASLSEGTRPANSTGLLPQRGRREGGVGGVVPYPHWHVQAARPCNGGRSGVGPHAPCYPGPQVWGWGRSEGGELGEQPLTTNVGWLLHNQIFANTVLSPKTHRFTPRFRENAVSHSAYPLKTRNSAFSLNTLYTAESESLQFCSAFSPTMISLTPRFHQKHKV